MWGKLLKSVRMETINKIGELCDVYFPRGLFVELNFSEWQNEGLDLDKAIKEVVEEIMKDTKEEQKCQTSK